MCISSINYISHSILCTCTCHIIKKKLNKHLKKIIHEILFPQRFPAQFAKEEGLSVNRALLLFNPSMYLTNVSKDGHCLNSQSIYLTHYSITFILQKLLEGGENGLPTTDQETPSIPPIQWRSQTQAHPGLGPGVMVRKTVEHRTVVVLLFAMMQFPTPS